MIWSSFKTISCGQHFAWKVEYKCMLCIWAKVSRDEMKHIRIPPDLISIPFYTNQVNKYTWCNFYNYKHSFHLINIKLYKWKKFTKYLFNQGFIKFRQTLLYYYFEISRRQLINPHQHGPIITLSWRIKNGIGRKTKKTNGSTQ